MYHYTECGLPNVFLGDGYRVIETSAGRAVSIQNVAGLHEAICQTLVEEKPAALTGFDVRFIRKFLDLTQSSLGELLGVQEQTVRGWERKKAEEIPPQADRAVRMVFRDITRKYSKTFEEVTRIAAAQLKTDRVQFSFQDGANGRWGHELVPA
jgi:DNA-binding transcriptional regulator YiaG